MRYLLPWIVFMAGCSEIPVDPCSPAIVGGDQMCVEMECEL